MSLGKLVERYLRAVRKTWSTYLLRRIFRGSRTPFGYGSAEPFGFALPRHRRPAIRRPVVREMVFVSHANPEDNEFALWLSLQLAKEGYPVWCDLTRLLGGELFWSDIEQAIRERTVKFLYVLTRVSNEKRGARDELALALGVERKDKLKDFVVPLWLDDLPPSEFNVELYRRNATPFQQGWANGLALVLKKLEEDGVPKKAGFGPAAVTAWWRDQVNASAGVRAEPETLYSNWYPLLPTTLYFHELGRDDPGPITVPDKLPYPGVRHAQYLVSFAPAEDFAGQLGPGMSIGSTCTRRLNDPDASTEPRLWGYRDERQHLTNLLRQAWERLVATRSLPTYSFATGAPAFYFTKGMLPDDRAWYQAYDGARSWRNIIGYKTLKGARDNAPGIRYWHFALELRPTSHPEIGYTMRSHVLFSDDGKTIWDSKDRLHRARRSQCKDWWNDRWRDLIAASVSFLAEGREAVRLPVGSEATICVAARPITLLSPLSFDETSLEPPVVDEHDDDDEDVSESGETVEEGDGDDAPETSE